MCGFSLVIDVEEHFVIDAMSCSLKHFQHRGPDDNGFKILHAGEKIVGFAHNRLSIIGGSNATQPLYDSKTGNVLLFNGEIYNFHELAIEFCADTKIELETSDTLLLSYLLNNYDFDFIIKKLRGMFAIVFYDKNNGKIKCSRDPFGTKPLYYSKYGDSFILSSEVGFINKLCQNEKINGDLLYENFVWGCNFSPNTIFDGVKSLQPSEVKVFDVNGIELRSEKLNNISDLLCPPYKSDQKIQDLWRCALQRTMTSDTPVGLLMSGGLDSSAIAVSLKHLNYSVTCFHLRIEGFVKEETLACRRLAKELEYELIEIVLTESEISKEIQNYIDCSDYPSDDGLNTFIVTKKVSKYGFKVLLHGVGGDELFGGYRAKKLLPILSWLLPITKKLKFLKLFYIPYMFRYNKLLSLLSSYNLLESYLNLRQINDRASMKQVFKNESLKLLMEKKFNFKKNLKVETLVSLLELKFYCAEKLLKDGDFYAMQNGIEMRFPILDLDFVAGALNEINDRKFYKLTKFHIWNKIINKLPIYLQTVSKTGFTITKTFNLNDKNASNEKRYNNKIMTNNLIEQISSLEKCAKHQNHFGFDCQIGILKKIVDGLYR